MLVFTMRKRKGLKSREGRSAVMAKTSGNSLCFIVGHGSSQHQGNQVEYAVEIETWEKVSNHKMHSCYPCRYTVDISADAWLISLHMYS